MSKTALTLAIYRSVIGSSSTYDPPLQYSACQVIRNVRFDAFRSQAPPAKRNQKAVSVCASLTARVSHVWESYPGDTPTASVIITIIRMRTIATEQFMIMVSRRLVIERASSNWFCDQRGYYSTIRGFVSMLGYPTLC